MESDPREYWDGDFGESYTQRNADTVEEMNATYQERFGVSRTELNQEFLDQLDREMRILEVGTNVGVQLECLRELGFENLYGIDIQRNAVRKAHQDRPELNIIEGDALDIPFRDEYFDLVFTSGVLIHIPPQKIPDAMDEIVRCSSQFIYGYEYYADEYTEITYRGNDELLWKADFAQIYQDDLDLTLTEERKLQYPDSGNTDALFLLEQ